ncbi:CD63 antigen-like isoform X2 [Orbicella faveolata]|uniref:CD63 antigen-like isoform X2 n=1 Tax=Orbicella faveolata TaxID=48498 RepID=UPI0009E5F1BA|nr:CD63 antigen-like isoform X2 [Orbicella faveolata]
MIAMEPEGSTDGFLRKKCVPFITGFELFMVLLAVRALIALIAGGVGINYIKEVKDKFEEDLQNSIENYGRTGKEKMTHIDRLQKQDECCGVFTYADWRATIYGGHRYDKVPDSCCKTEEYACGFKFTDEATLNKKGCASIALDKMFKHLRIVGASGITSGIIEVILFIFFLTCYLKVCNSGTHNQPVAAVTVGYQKTDDMSGGDDESGAQEGSAPSTREHDVLSPQGSRSGAKATLPPLKTAPETSEETRTEEHKKKKRKKSK